LDEPESKSMERRHGFQGLSRRPSPQTEPGGAGTAKAPGPRRAGVWGAHGKVFRAAHLALLLAIAIVSFGCSGGPGTGRSANSPEGLEAWQGPMATLFDDSIHPAAVGLSLEGGRAQDDPLLRPRALSADLVARMRVSTVTRDEAGAKVTYTLVLQVGNPPLLSPTFSEPTVELTIRKWSPAFGIVGSLESSIRGKTFIGFVKRLAGEHGPELHWHLTADTEDVAAVVSTASAIEETAEQ
jgi:hypothetical protein